MLPPSSLLKMPLDTVPFTASMRVINLAAAGEGALVFVLSRMPNAFCPIKLPRYVASIRSFTGMSKKVAFGVSALQYAGKHFEMPTQEQLNSPTIHLSMVHGVPGLPGSELMKSAVHYSGSGSLGNSRFAISVGMSFSVKSDIKVFLKPV